MIREYVKYAVGGLILICLLGASTDQRAPGRFTVVQGHYQANMKAATIERKSIIKLDTQTGDAWYLYAGSSDSGYQEVWRKIGESEH